MCVSVVLFASASLAGTQESADGNSGRNGEKRLFAQDACRRKERQIGLHLRPSTTFFLAPTVTVLQRNEDSDQHQRGDDQRDGDRCGGRDRGVASAEIKKSGCEREDICSDE